MRISKGAYAVIVASGYALFLAVIPEKWRPLSLFVAALAIAFGVIGWLYSHCDFIKKFRHSPSGKSPVIFIIVCSLGALISGIIWHLIDPLPDHKEITEPEKPAAGSNHPLPPQQNTELRDALEVIEGLKVTLPQQMSDRISSEINGRYFYSLYVLRKEGKDSMNYRQAIDSQEAANSIIPKLTATGAQLRQTITAIKLLCVGNKEVEKQADEILNYPPVFSLNADALPSFNEAQLLNWQLQGRATLLGKIEREYRAPLDRLSQLVYKELSKK